jgi:hypothetical protein
MGWSWFVIRVARQDFIEQLYRVSLHGTTSYDF